MLFFQGGVNSDLTMSAYVAIAFLESWPEVKFVKQKHK